MVVVLVTAASCTRTAGDSNKDATVYRHQVQEGETLDSVARQYYLDAAEAERIGEFNMVTDDELTVGMTLRVPMTSKEIARLKLREQARVPYNEGLVLAEKGAYIDAIQKFKTALDVDSDFADAHYNVGVSLQMMKSYDKATDSFKKAIRRDPTNVDYEFALGNCYFYQQSYQSAAGAFERTIEAKPPCRQDAVNQDSPRYSSSY